MVFLLQIGQFRGNFNNKNLLFLGGFSAKRFHSFCSSAGGKETCGVTKRARRGSRTLPVASLRVASCFGLSSRMSRP